MTGLVEAIVTAVVSVLLKWLEKRAELPDTLHDAKTPTALRERWAAYLRNKLRDQDSSNRQ